MGKKFITGRIALAVLLCAILLTSALPHTVYAAKPAGVPSDVPDEWFSDLDEDYYESGEWKGADYSHLEYSSNKSGLINSSNTDTSIYQGEDEWTVAGDDSYYKTDISKQLKEEKPDGVIADIANWAWTTLLENFGIDTGKQGVVADLLSELIYLIASSLHAIMDNAGIGLDNIIFGRVNGNGMRVDDAGTVSPADDTVVSLFHFELEKGNPYGVVAALIYSMIRKYMYIIMIVIAFASFMRVAWNNDNPTAKKDFKDKLTSLIQVFGLIVFMPYFLEAGLYIRNIMLHGIVGDSMFSLFQSNKTGLLSAFRDNCDTGIMGALGLESPPLMASVLYLAATCISLILAAMYVANAMAMLIHTIAFPVLCVKSFFDKRALGGWVLEMIGLAAVPILDGILLLVPLIFNKAANGTVGLNFVSLLACACMMTARQQFRKALGLQSNNMLESGGLMTAMGMARLISSVGRAGKRAVGQAAGGLKQGASDDLMGKYYETQAANDKIQRMDAEAKLDNGFPIGSLAESGVGVNPAAQSGMGYDMGAGGNLAYRAQKYNEAKERAMNPMNKDGAASAYEVSGHEGVFDATTEELFRENELRNAQVAAIMGKSAPIQDDEMITDYVNIDNFESQEFANKLSNATKAKMYRERAKHARRQGLSSAALTAGGAVAGGFTAFAATAYMDSGTSAMITSAGVDLGSSAGGAAAGVSSIARGIKEANKEHSFTGYTSELGYTIKQDKNGTEYHTFDKYDTRQWTPLDAEVPADLPSVQPDVKGAVRAPQHQEGWYQTNGEQISGPKTDANTGEYYYTGDGSTIYATENKQKAAGQPADVSFNEEVSVVLKDAGADSSQEGIKVTAEPTFNTYEDAQPVFVEFMNNHKNLKDSYESSLVDAVNATWNNVDLKASGNTKYKAAEQISKEMQAKVNISPEQKSEGNDKIEKLREATHAEIHASVHEPVMRDVHEAAHAYGIDIPPKEDVAIDIVTGALSDAQVESYVYEQGWDFNSLVIK